MKRIEGCAAAVAAMKRRIRAHSNRALTSSHELIAKNELDVLQQVLPQDRAIVEDAPTNDVGAICEGVSTRIDFEHGQVEGSRRSSNTALSS